MILYNLILLYNEVDPILLNIEISEEEEIYESVHRLDNLLT